jgi:hypothetical protein
MATKTKITVKGLLKGKKLKVTEPGGVIPLGIIGGKVTRVFYRTMDSGAVPYFRGMFWSQDLITAERIYGEVCILPPAISGKVLEQQLLSAGPGVEFAYRISVLAAGAFAYDEMIAPRVDDALRRLESEVGGLLELFAAVQSQQQKTAKDGGDDDSSVRDVGDAASVGADSAGASGAGGDDKGGENTGAQQPAGATGEAPKDAEATATNKRKR